MVDLFIASARAELRDSLGSLIDFNTYFLDVGNSAPWPPIGPDGIIVADQSWLEGLPEDRRRILPSANLILLVDSSSAVPVIAVRHDAAMKLFYYQALDGFTLENLLCLIRTAAERATLSSRLDSYIRDSFRDIIDSTLLQKQKEEIESLNEQLRELSRIDALTELLNRRALLEAFEQEKRRALRHRWRLRQSSIERPSAEQSGDTDFRHEAKGQIGEHIGNFTCIIIDIDHFKLVNDSYGHLTGDRVLCVTGKLLNRTGLFRESDIRGRYGGEEFIVLLPETNAENSLIPARRFADAYRSEDFVSDDGRHFRLTVSMGIAEFLPWELSCDEMMKRADQALYHAKEHGRDRICLFSEIAGGD